MGAVLPPAPVQPIVGVLAASPSLLAEARDAISAAIAPIALASGAAVWTQSDYYRAEMGAALWRQYLALDDTMAPDDLAELKRLTNAMEKCCGARGRAVNLDPGYLDLLRGCWRRPDAAHRVGVGAGIYAEATLHFVHGCLSPGRTPTRLRGCRCDRLLQQRTRTMAHRARVEGADMDGRARWRRGSAPTE
jgi:hypothetical protein